MDEHIEQPAETTVVDGRARDHAKWLALWCKHTPDVLVQALVDDIPEA